ncbi:MAG: hypothetical protein FJ138_03220 [Deltaproteobacteria bacterium]|nr:hypothetical protein [Deltaproteobacteria bacterium]
MPGPLNVRFKSLRQGNGDFVGEWSVPVLIESREDLARLTRVKVRVLDETGYASALADLELLPTPTAAISEECDVNRGLSRCADGALCGDAAGGRKKCAAATTACPPYYDVVDLNAAGGRYEGDTTGLATYGRGFCGGGTASKLFSFTADAAGQYAFTSQPLSAPDEAPTGPDTLMWIRSHCAFSDWVAELGCNDDINRAIGDLGSRLVLDLAAGQVVYVFIDGYSDPETGMAGWSGRFLLEVAAL